MKKLLLFCLTILLACFVSNALAKDLLDDLEIDQVVCPNNGFVTAGAPLDVTVKVINKGPQLTLTRAAVVLSGNPVGTLGGTGMWGPFPRSINVTVPAYGAKQFTLRIVSNVPTSLKGKIAAAGVSILSHDPDEPNEPADANGCLVIVQ